MPIPHMRRKLADNLKRVRDRIAAAAGRAGRSPDSVTLVAVTKTVEVDVIRMMLELGATQLGESRVQELAKRASMIEEYRSRRQLMGGSQDVPPAPTWHMIGHLQRNKVRQVLPWARIIHSVDSLRLAEDISAQGAKAGYTTDIFLQVNVSGERTKFGMAVGATGHLLDQIREMPSIRIVGLMTMAPLVDDPEKARPHFVRLRELFEEIRAEHRPGPDFRHLSMGMSNDFEVAVEEGATMVRIGTALFEGLGARAGDE